MCRNIKPLFNFDPPASDEEIKDASVQFVKKISGFQKPSKTNEKVFNAAVEKMSNDIKNLLNNLETDSKPRTREKELEKTKERNKKRFG